MIGFMCGHCRQPVNNSSFGTVNRNNCPSCLFSLHVDNKVGDRTTLCGGVMPPIGKLLKKDGEEVLVHRCKRCGAIRKNRVAGDDDDGLVRGLEVLKTL